MLVLRGLPAETRLTVYRWLQVPAQGDVKCRPTGTNVVRSTLLCVRWFAFEGLQLEAQFWWNWGSNKCVVFHNFSKFFIGETSLIWGNGESLLSGLFLASFAPQDASWRSIKCATSGKPSTRLPLGGLVEQVYTQKQLRTLPLVEGGGCEALSSRSMVTSAQLLWMLFDQ